MKKTYIVPNLKVVTVKIKNSILIGSGDKLGVHATGGNGAQLGREDNSWDIWGNDDYED